jgi:nucleoid DNA-binding protein
MTKQELIERVYKNPRAQDGVSLSKKTVQSLVETVFDELADYFVRSKLSKSEVPKFTYPAFGTFTKRKRPERPGRNPQTGQAITIPATYTVAFSPGQDLKNALNKGK